MKTFKQLTESISAMPLEARYHYSVYQMVNNKPQNRENLNYDEVAEYMDRVRSKWGSIMVVRSDGKYVIYADDGKKYVSSKKGKLKSDDKLIP